MSTSLSHPSPQPVPSPALSGPADAPHRPGPPGESATRDEHGLTLSSPTADDAELTAAAAVVDGVFRAAQQLRHVVNEHLAEFGLNEARFAAMQIIHEHSEEGCTQAMLADRLQQSESSISGLVRRMRASGLLYRLRSKSDQRKWGLMLSDRGRRVLADLAQCHAERMRHLLREFNRGQLLTFADLLAKLLDEVGEALEKRQTPLPPANSDVPRPVSANQMPAA